MELGRGDCYNQAHCQFRDREETPSRDIKLEIKDTDEQRITNAKECSHELLTESKLGEFDGVWEDCKLVLSPGHCTARFKSNTIVWLSKPVPIGLPKITRDEEGTDEKEDLSFGKGDAISSNVQSMLENCDVSPQQCGSVGYSPKALSKESSPDGTKFYDDADRRKRRQERYKRRSQGAKGDVN